VVEFLGGSKRARIFQSLIYLAAAVIWMKVRRERTTSNGSAELRRR